MKILILHLSDFHIQDRNTLDFTTWDRVLDTLNCFSGKVDHCCVVISGDIAFSGLQSQYDMIKGSIGYFRGNICKRLGIDEYIQLFIVPGNHDIDYNKVERKQSDISSCIKSEENIEKLILADEQSENDFFDFCRQVHSTWNNFQYRAAFWKECNIKFNLLNTAIFSSKEIDKGYHYIQDKYFDCLSAPNDDNKYIVITVMHHHPEWLHESIKLPFEEKLIESTSILMLGHEHSSSTKNLSWDQKDIVIVAGGVLGGGKNKESTYNVVLLDTEKNIVETVKYSWNHDSKIYIPGSSIKSNLIYKRYDNNKIKPDESYIKYLYKDEKHVFKRPLVDYFVFPRLTEVPNCEYFSESEISDWEKFEKVLTNNQFITVFGSENSGKTSLAKFLSYRLLKKYNVLFFIPDDIKSKRINKVVRETFENQYSEDVLEYARFQQIQKKYKVAIIDDVHKIKEQDLSAFTEYLKDDFEYIIMFSQDKLDLDFFERARKEIFHNKLKEYHIEPFYLDKHEELINKIFDIFGNELIDRNEFLRSVNNFIKTQLNVFKINPNFIIQYIWYYLSKINHDNQKDVFSEIFEMNIYQAIDNVKKAEKTDVILILLSEIAIYIHRKKKYPIAYTDINSIIKEYNAEYDFNVNTDKFLQSLIDGKIFKKSSQESPYYYFSDNNYLAYFIAKKLHKEYINVHSTDDIQYILNNICFGINSEIILFLSYITRSDSILMFLIEIAERYVHDWIELNLNDMNIEFLINYQSELSIEAPSNNEVKRAEELSVHTERIQDNARINTVEIYDYDEKEAVKWTNQILIAIKYMHIIARILPAFTHILKKNDKQKIVETIYVYPNKIAYQLLKYLDGISDEKFNQFVKEVNSSGEKKFDKNDIKHLLYKLCLGFILTFYDSCANIATDKNTLHLLEKYKPNINYYTYDVQNLMLYDIMGNVDKFIEKIKAIKSDILNDRDSDAKSNTTLYNLIMLVAHKFLVTHKQLPLKQDQYLRNNFFYKRSNSISQNHSKNTFPNSDEHEIQVQKNRLLLQRATIKEK